MRRVNIVSGVTEERNTFFGGTPVEHTDTIVYNGADYEAIPDPRYTIGATLTNVGYATRDQYQVWYDGRYQTTWNPDTIREQVEREGYERTIEDTIEEYDTLRERAHRLNPIANGVTIVSEREYAQMGRDGNLDPNEIYYTYPDTDDGLTTAWTERHPKTEIVAYFIS